MILSPVVQKYIYRIIIAAALGGVILTLASWFRLCSGSCEEGHKWRLFGLPFEITGLLFFIILATLHIYSTRFPSFSFYAGLMTLGALGAEFHFILLQKYVIGRWCPLCLSIASCVMIAAIGFGIRFFAEFSNSIKQKQKGEIMNNIWKGISAVTILVLGFFISVVGSSKYNPLEAAENTIKESVIFGNKESPIEIYIFTDWACPACRQQEPEIEKMAPALMKNWRVTFVDYAIHTETLNYSPYNVSFMIKNKDKYIELRHALTELSIKNEAPTDEQVEKIAEKFHTKYQQLHFSDIVLSQKYFKQLAKQFGVNKTPTIVVVNRETKKGKRVVGHEINEKNVLKAIESLSKVNKNEKKESDEEESEDI